MVIRTLLVDDHQIVREGLRALLDIDGEIDVVGEASNGAEALRMIPGLAPEVVVMDVEMPEMNGIEATRQIEEHFHNIKVVALSAHSDRAHVTHVLDAGAAAYVPKMDAHEELVRAVKAVSAGQSYLSPEVAGHVIDRLRDDEGEHLTPAVQCLSPRERRVLQLLAEGKSGPESATLLGISAKTVETHRRNISKKLDVHGTAELTKYAVREGLTSLDS